MSKQSESVATSLKHAFSSLRDTFNLLFIQIGNGSFRPYSRSDPGSFRSYSLSVRSFRPGSFRPDFRGGSFRPSFGGSFRTTLIYIDF